jgi:hypothetical protein
LRQLFPYTNIKRKLKSKFDIAAPEFKIVETNTEPERHAG